MASLLKSLYDRLEGTKNDNDDIPEDLAKLLQIGDFYTHRSDLGASNVQALLKCELNEDNTASNQENNEAAIEQVDEEEPEEDYNYFPEDNFIDDFDDEGPPRQKRKYTKRKKKPIKSAEKLPKKRGRKPKSATSVKDEPFDEDYSPELDSALGEYKEESESGEERTKMDASVQDHEQDSEYHNPEMGPLLSYDEFKARVETCSGILEGIVMRKVPFSLWKIGGNWDKRRVSGQRAQMRFYCPFRVLVGLAQDGDKSFRARPLAWVDPTPEQIERQYDDTVRAYRHFFGFSEADCAYHPWMYCKQGLGCQQNLKKAPNKFIESNFVRTEQELRDMLNDPRLKAIQTRGSMKVMKVKQEEENEIGTY